MVRKIAIAIGLIAVSSMPVVAQQFERILIFGGTNHDEYLGCINCSEMDPDSVWNDMSRFGWGNSLGKWNSFSSSRNPYSSGSACNEYSGNGPILVDRRGTFYGTLTINPYAKGSICGARGDEQVCRALKAMCASD